MKTLSKFFVFILTIGVIHFTAVLLSPLFSSKCPNKRTTSIVRVTQQQTIHQEPEKPVCQDSQHFIYGPVTLNLSVPAWNDLEKTFVMLKPGGRYVPYYCRPKHRIAIIIPYRDREQHLKLFLQYMHLFLQGQNLDYTIYVVELEKGVIFKKGLLMNAGFLEVSKSTDIKCFIFHDVDMLPMHTGLSYTCHGNHVIHPAKFIRQYNYTHRYKGYLGGVMIFPKERFEQVNGFSNLYWGWGGEDDDMNIRLKSLRIDVSEPENNDLRYISWAHDREVELENRKQFVEVAAERMFEDGLINANYSVLSVEKKQLYTWILVSAKQTDGSYNGLKQVYKPNTRREIFFKKN